MGSRARRRLLLRHLQLPNILILLGSSHSDCVSLLEKNSVGFPGVDRRGTRMRNTGDRQAPKTSLLFSPSRSVPSGLSLQSKQHPRRIMPDKTRSSIFFHNGLRCNSLRTRRVRNHGGWCRQRQNKEEG